MSRLRDRIRNPFGRRIPESELGYPAIPGELQFRTAETQWTRRAPPPSRTSFDTSTKQDMVDRTTAAAIHDDILAGSSPTHATCTENDQSFVDSGYGSKSSESSKQSTARHDDALETSSIRTDGRVNDLPMSLKESLTGQFVSHLVDKTKRNVLSGVEARDIEELVRDFSILLSTAANDKTHEQAFTFIRHQRAVIGARFAEILQAWMELHTDTPISSQDRMNLLYQADPDGEDLHPHVARSMSSVSSRSGFPEYDGPVPQDLPRARDFLLDSDAFQWLVVHTRALTRVQQTGDTYAQVRASLVDTIGKLSPDAEMVLDLDWHPQGFLKDQFDTMQPDLRRVVVYCGSPHLSSASTAAAYAHLIWPRCGRRTVECLNNACINPSGTAEEDFEIGTLKVQFTSHGTEVRLSGDAPCVLEIAEVCVWLATACRENNTGPGVGYLVPTLRETIVPGTGGFAVDVMVHQIEASLTDSGSLCWFGMVCNPILAIGYPVPKRTDHDRQRGLEVSLDLMVALSQADWATTFGNTFLLKGAISAIVPVYTSSTSTSWHFMLNEDGSRMSYGKACAAGVPTGLSHLDYKGLARRRHFVGLWTPSARILARSSDPSLYDIRLSQNSGEVDETTISWTGITLTGGKFVTASTAFTLGKKDVAAAYSQKSDSYYWHIRVASHFQVLLYGDSDRRAWLVDGVSALAHLVKAYLTAECKNFQGSDAARNLQHVVGKGGVEEATDVLLANRSIPIYTSEQSLRQTAASPSSGLDSGTSATDSAYASGTASMIRPAEHETGESKPDLVYEDMVLHFYRILEVMRDAVGKAESNVPRLIIKRPTTRPVLAGWDARDIIIHRNERGNFQIRAAKLHQHAKGWLDYVEEIGAVVLLAKMFGDLIQPRGQSGGCRRASLVPRYQDFLTIPLGMFLERGERYIDTARDSSDGCVRVWKNAYWHGFENYAQPCAGSELRDCPVVSRIGPKDKRATVHTAQKPLSNVFVDCPDGAATIGGPESHRAFRKCLPEAAAEKRSTDETRSTTQWSLGERSVDSDSVYYMYLQSDRSFASNIAPASDQAVAGAQRDDPDEEPSPSAVTAVSTSPHDATDSTILATRAQNTATRLPTSKPKTTTLSWRQRLKAKVS